MSDSYLHMHITSLLTRLETLAGFLSSPLILVLRLFWGWQFAQAGWGKLMNLEKTAGFFGSIGIPFSYLSAIMAGGTEFLGGLLLAFGLWTRVASLPLIFTMVVAYATAHREELLAIGSDPEKFTSAAPFLFLLVSTVTLAFGPGIFSVDRLLNRKELNSKEA